MEKDVSAHSASTGPVTSPPPLLPGAWLPELKASCGGLVTWELSDGKELSWEAKLGASLSWSFTHPLSLEPYLVSGPCLRQSCAQPWFLLTPNLDHWLDSLLHLIYPVLSLKYFLAITELLLSLIPITRPAQFSFLGIVGLCPGQQGWWPAWPVLTLSSCLPSMSWVACFYFSLTKKC